MDRRPRALVVEYGLSRGALAGARALAAGGWAVGVAGSPAVRVTASSRTVSRWHPLPSVQQEDAFIAAVADAVRTDGYEVVFPTDEGQLLALSRRRDEIGAAFPFAEHDRVTRALDRLEVARTARAAGLMAPAEVELDEARLAERTAPVVVKARTYGMLEEDGHLARIETAIVSGAEAPARIAQIRGAGVEALVQEPVAGRLSAFVGLIDRDGDLLGATQQQADRIYPAEAGISVRAHTVPTDPQLAVRARDLLRALGWFGLVELQFLTPEGGEPHLIDFNGRFYGSMALALAAGANLPDAWARLATGRFAGQLAPGRPGVRYQWLEGDLRRCLSRGGGASPAELLRTVGYAAGAVHSVARLRDPGPLAAILRLRLGRAAGRRLGWRRSQQSTR